MKELDIRPTDQLPDVTLILNDGIDLRTHVKSHNNKVMETPKNFSIFSTKKIFLPFQAAIISIIQNQTELSKSLPDGFCEREAVSLSSKSDPVRRGGAEGR